MPVYEGILLDKEIIASLSYIKSKRPTDAIDIHDRINADFKTHKETENQSNRPNDQHQV